MDEHYNIGSLSQKSYAFALRIVNAHKYLVDKHEHVLSKQLLRSGTSIGANCRESKNAQSKVDFVHKLSIALKEADETAYWLELLKDTNYIPKDVYESIYNDCIELVKLLTTIIKTTKENITVDGEK